MSCNASSPKVGELQLGESAMTISVLDAINNQQVSLSFRRSEILGAEFFSDLWATHGASEAERGVFQAKLEGAIVDRVEELQHDDIVALSDLLDDAANILHSSSSEPWRSAVVTAETMANADQSTASGRGQKPSKVVLAALLTLLLSLQVSGKYDTRTGEGVVEFSIGAPSRISALMDTVRKMLIEAPSSPGGKGAAIANKPEPTTPPKFEKDDDQPAGPTKSDLGLVAAPAIATASPAGAPRIASLAGAQAVIARIGEAWRAGEILAALGDKDGARALFRKAGKAKPDDLLEKAFNAVPFILGYGIVAQAQRTAEGPEVFNFRPAVRVQCPDRPRAATMKRLAKLIDEAGAGNCQTRWSSPVCIAASNPTGNIGRWAASDRSPPNIGARIGAAGGSAGALGLFLRKGKAVVCVTAGHVAWDDGQNLDSLMKFPETRAFYHPLQAEEPSHGVTPMGFVGFCEVFPRGSVRSGISESSQSRDFCTIEPEPGFVPAPAYRNLMGQRQFVMDWWRGDAPEGLRVIKSSARTRELVGVVNSASLRTQVFNHLTQEIQDSGPLVEIQVEGDGLGADFGDSGSLVCLERGGTLTPLGIVVAHAKSSLLSGDQVRARPLIYVQSFDSVLSDEPRLDGFKVA